jgi:hypothetical protein
MGSWWSATSISNDRVSRSSSTATLLSFGPFHDRNNGTLMRAPDTGQESQLVIAAAATPSSVIRLHQGFGSN